ncbi:MAG TPA: hypothetical protein VIL36_17465 [Acidimicrobiales bacterium]
MDDRTRKLGLLAMGVALFAGFVALTKWTGDDPGSIESMDDAEQSDLMELCSVLASDFVPYETLLRVAAGELGRGALADVGFNDSAGVRMLVENQIDLLADRVPDEYGPDARHAAEGLERAMDGELEQGEVEGYVASFERLQREAADDCAALEEEYPPLDGDLFEDDDFMDDGREEGPADGGPPVTFDPGPTSLPAP